MEIDPKKVSEAAKIFGAVGGRSGTGDAKRRSPEHYKRTLPLMLAARRKKALERKRAEKKAAQTK